MKKLILFGLLITATTGAFAQLKLGLHASPGLSWITPSGVSGIESDGIRAGISYGLMLDYGFTENYAFSSGISHNLTGGKILISDTILGVSVTNSYSIKLQYIDIPITLKLKTNQIGDITYFGQFGVTPGINIKAEQKMNSGDYVDINDDVNLLNMGLTLGAGIEYALSEKTAFVTGLTFNNGFMNIIDDNNDDSKYKLKSLALRAGIMF